MTLWITAGTLLSQFREAGLVHGTERGGPGVQIGLRKTFFTNKTKVDTCAEFSHSNVT